MDWVRRLLVCASAGAITPAERAMTTAFGFHRKRAAARAVAAIRVSLPGIASLTTFVCGPSASSSICAQPCRPPALQPHATLLPIMRTLHGSGQEQQRRESSARCP